jgi:hypothetical protein
VLGDPLNLEAWRGPATSLDQVFALNGVPVPEPSTALLLGLGLAGLATRGWIDR